MKGLDAATAIRLSMLLGLFCLSSGCGRQVPEGEAQNPRSNLERQWRTNSDVQVVNTTAKLETEIIQVVREWYAANKLEVPDRIIIAERNATRWIVLTGPAWREIEFEIDPNTKGIIRAFSH